MLKIGSFTQDIPAHTQINVEGQSEFVVLELDKEGKASHMVARSNDRQCKMTIRKDTKLKFDILGKNFISLEAHPVQSDHETVSPIPYEIPGDNQANMTLEEKLKRYLSEMVQERYGEDSAAYDTFEEAMDFDPDDEDPLSGFEINDVIEEEPVTPPETPPPGS